MDTGGSKEDDLTINLKEIMDVNVALEIALDNGLLTRPIIEECFFQYFYFHFIYIANMIAGDTPGMSKPIGVKPIRGFFQRLQGKQGRFRGNQIT